MLQLMVTSSPLATFIRWCLLSSVILSPMATKSNARDPLGEVWGGREEGVPDHYGTQGVAREEQGPGGRHLADAPRVPDQQVQAGHLVQAPHLAGLVQAVFLPPQLLSRKYLAHRLEQGDGRQPLQLL